MSLMLLPLSGSQSIVFPVLGGALFVLVWDWAISLDDEVGLIWSRDHRSYLKWLYMISRYLIFGAQLFHRMVEISIRYQFNLNPQRLRVWYCGQVVTGALCVSALEIVLMTRVYALYMKKRIIAITLVSLLVMELVVATVGLIVTYGKEQFLPLDILGHLPRSFVYFGISGLVVQSIILALTLFKYFSGNMKAVPIVKKMTRDGTLTFFLITILCLVVVVYTIQQHPFGLIAFAWLLTIVSTSTCRLIVNMLRIPSPDEGSLSTSMQFTTVFTDRITLETAESYPIRHSTDWTQ